MTGNVFTKHQDIGQGFVNFFFDLWTEPSSKLFLEIFDAFLYVLSQITTSEGDMLINEVTKTEAFQALQLLPSSKSPRPDSLNAKYIDFTEMILEMLFFPAIR